MQGATILLAFSLAAALPLLTLAASPTTETISTPPGSTVTLDLSKGEVKADTATCTPPPGQTSCTKCTTLSFKSSPGLKGKVTDVSCYVDKDHCPPPEGMRACEATEVDEAKLHSTTNSAQVGEWDDTFHAYNYSYLRDLTKEGQQLVLPNITNPYASIPTSDFRDSAPPDLFLQGFGTLDTPPQEDPVLAAALSFSPYIGSLQPLGLTPLQDPSLYLTHLEGSDLYKTPTGEFVSLHTGDAWQGTPDLPTDFVSNPQGFWSETANYTNSFFRGIGEWSWLGLHEEATAGIATCFGQCGDYGAVLASQQELSDAYRQFYSPGNILGQTVAGLVPDPLTPVLALSKAGSVLAMGFVPAFRGVERGIIPEINFSRDTIKETVASIQQGKFSEYAEKNLLDAGFSEGIVAQLPNNPAVKAALLQNIEEKGITGFSDYERFLETLGYSKGDIAQIAKDPDMLRVIESNITQSTNQTAARVEWERAGIITGTIKTPDFIDLDALTSAAVGNRNTITTKDIQEAARSARGDSALLEAYLTSRQQELTPSALRELASDPNVQAGIAESLIYGPAGFTYDEIGNIAKTISQGPTLFKQRIDHFELQVSPNVIEGIFDNPRISNAVKRRLTLYPDEWATWSALGFKP